METQEIGQLSVMSEPGFSFASKDIIGELKEPEKSLWLVKSIIPTLISWFGSLHSGSEKEGPSSHICISQEIHTEAFKDK